MNTTFYTVSYVYLSIVKKEQKKIQLNLRDTGLVLNHAIESFVHLKETHLTAYSLLPRIKE